MESEMSEQLQKRLLMGMVILVISSPAYSKDLIFCKRLFGTKAETSLEPKESNRGGVEDNFINEKSAPIRIQGLKKPTGFVCIVEIDSSSKDKCRSGLHVDLKRNEFPTCVSKVFPLKKLCPNEIKEIWPDLKDIVCKNKIKSDGKKSDK